MKHRKHYNYLIPHLVDYIILSGKHVRKSKTKYTTLLRILKKEKSDATNLSEMCFSSRAHNNLHRKITLSQKKNLHTILGWPWYY